MSRSILQVFEEYQKSRITFVQTIAEFALRQQNTEILQNAGVLPLLKPLLLDTVPTVQQTAALALGRLAGNSIEIATACVEQNIISHLVQCVSQQNKYYKRPATFAIRSVAKHSGDLAKAVVDCGALEALSVCLEGFDSNVKESAALAIGYIAKHSESLVLRIILSGIVPLLALCFQEPEISLKRAAATSLCEIAKHSPDTAQAVCDVGILPLFSKQLSHTDTHIKRQVCCCFARVASHALEFAEAVVAAEIFPKILHCLKDPDDLVRRHAATCLKEIVRQSQDMAKFVANAGGIAALIDYIAETQGASRVAGITALGYIAAYAETLALAIIISKGIMPLKDVLCNDTDADNIGAAAWCLGQLGRHTPEHAMAVAEADVLRKILEFYVADESSEELKNKCKRALKGVLSKCLHLEALEPLIKHAPTNILKHIIEQFAKVLPNDPKARRQFVQTGGLEQLLTIRESEDSIEFAKTISDIVNLYPVEVINYYSPGYSITLLEKMDAMAQKDI